MTTTTKERFVIELWPLAPERTPEQELALRVADAMTEDNWCMGRMTLGGRHCARGWAIALGGPRVAGDLNTAFFAMHSRRMSTVNDRNGLEAIKAALRELGDKV